MCRYTLAKFILLLSLTISSFNSMAGVGTNYNRKGVVIKYDTPQANHVRYNTGDSAELNGSICVSKYSSIFNKLKCRATLQGNVSVRAYFPDAMTEVTDQLKIKKKGQEYQWSFKTPELISGNENTLHILVAKDDLKIKKLERLQAKLNKRIVLLEKRIQQRNKRGSNVRLISWLNDLKDRLERVSKNIDELIEEDASVLAQIKIPLQVDNDVAFPFYYSSFFSGHKMSFRAPIGSAIEGDRVTIEATTKNLSGKSFWFPGIDDKNDKNDESFNDDDLNQYKLDLYFNNALKVSSGFSEIAYGQENKISFNTDKLSISDLNNFDLKLTKKLNLHFKLFKKKVSLDFPYGEIGFTLPVSIDDVKPTISTDFFSEGETSLSKFENVKYLAKDSFGHLVNDSISIEIKNAQDEVVSGTSVTSARINAEEVEYNVSNSSLADGAYQITALIKDNAGNESTKLVNEFFVDNSAPILIENNTPNGFIAGDKLDLDFKVGDVSSVEVIVFSNGEKLLTTSNKHVQESITLSSGENIISAKLSDSLGNTVTVDIATVSIDNDAPVLANNSTFSGYTANSNLTLNFSITDISTVTTEVFNNGTRVLSTTNKNVNESIDLSSGSNNITVVMTDAAGNESNAEISNITLDNVSPKLSRNANSDSVLSTSSYTLDFSVQDSTLVTTTVYNNGSKILETNESLVNNSVTLSYGVNEITVSMSDSAGNTSSANIAKLTLDNKKPVLLQNNTKGGFTTNKSLSLDFSIEDLTAVDIKVLRNGVEVLSSIEKVINTSIDLIEGSNEITASVIDQAGNTESFTIAQVIYDGTKPTISSINLIEGQNLDSLTYELKGAVSEELSSLSINGDSVSLNESSFLYTISNTEEGAKFVVIAMSDLAGNTNELTINYVVQLAPEEFECLKKDFSEAAACSEEFIAQSFSDVESYKLSSDLNNKNLVLAFSYSGEEHLIVHTSCSINVAENFSFTTTGGVCLDSRDGLNIQTQSQLSASEVGLFSDHLINIEENASLNSVDSFSASSPECTFKNTSLTGAGNCFDPSRPVVKVSTTKTNLEIGETLSFSTSESVVPNGISSVEFFINDLKQDSSTNSFNHTFNEEGLFYVKAKITDSNGYISSNEIKINVSAPIINTREAFFKYAVEDEMLELIFVQSIPRDQIKTAKFVVDGQDYILPNYYHLDSIYINDISIGNHDVILEVTDIYDQVFKYQRSVFVGTNEEMTQLPPVMEFEVVPSAPRKVFIEFRDVFDPAKLFDGLVIDWGDGQESEHWIPDEGGVKHQYTSAGTYEVSVEFVKYGDEELVTTLTKEVIVTDDEVSPAPPIVNFRYEKQYFAPHVTFNVDLSMSPTGEIVSRTFDYGDGTVYTGIEPIHTHFYEPGTYYPTLTIVDEYGMTASQTARVIIADEGEDFISHLECFDEGGLYVGCDVVALAKDEEIQSIEIDWGDGNIETFEPAYSSWTWDFFEHEYFERDNYVIRVSVTTNANTYNASYEYISLSASILCERVDGLNISCNGTNSSSSNRIVKYEWVIENEILTGEVISHTFSAFGTYSVVLKIYDENGESDMSNIEFTVLPDNIPPEISVEGKRFANIIPFNLDLNISVSDREDGVIDDIEWQLYTSANELLSSGFSEDVYLELNNYDSYKLDVIARDSLGQETIESFYILIVDNNVAPTAHITQDKTVVLTEGQVSFDASSSYDENDEIISYRWYIDGQLVSSEVDFMYNFNGLGSYEIELEVEDKFGEISKTSTKVDSISLIPESIYSEIFVTEVTPSYNSIVFGEEDIIFTLSESINSEVTNKSEIFINGVKIESSNIYIVENRVVINRNVIPEGRVIVEIEILDTLGQIIKSTSSFYKASASISLGNCSDLITNYGNLNFYVEVLNENRERGHFVLDSDCNLPLFPIDNFALTVTSNNGYMFNSTYSGAAEFKIESLNSISDPNVQGEAVFTARSDSWAGDTSALIEVNNMLELDTNNSSNLRKTFVSDKDQVIFFNMNIALKGIGRKVSVSIRGSEGGEPAILNMLGTNKVFNEDIVLKYNAKEGETIEVQVIYQLDDGVYTFSNPIFRFLNLIVSKVTADDENSFKMSEIKSDKYFFTFVPLDRHLTFSRSGTLSTSVTNHTQTFLSFSKIPDVYKQQNGSELSVNVDTIDIAGIMSSSKCEGESCVNFFKDKDIRLDIVLPHKTVSANIVDMKLITTDKKRGIFSIGNELLDELGTEKLYEISPNRPVSAYYKVVVTDNLTGEEIDTPNQGVFYLLSHIDTKFKRYNINVTPSYDHDLDGWATVHTAKHMNRFLDMLPGFLAVGDASLINASRSSSHEGHIRGRELDVMTDAIRNENVGSNGKVVRNNKKLVNDLEYVFDNFTDLHWGYVGTNRPADGNEIADKFVDDLRSRCLANQNRLLSQYALLRNEDHHGHLHLSFEENLPGIGKVKQSIGDIPTLTSFEYKKVNSSSAGETEYVFYVEGENVTRFYLVRRNDDNDIVEFIDSGSQIGKDIISLKSKVKIDKEEQLQYYKLILINDEENTLKESKGTRSVNLIHSTLASCLVEDVTVYASKTNICDEQVGRSVFVDYKDQDGFEYSIGLDGFIVKKGDNYTHLDRGQVASVGKVCAELKLGETGGLMYRDQRELHGTIDSQFWLNIYSDLEIEDKSLKNDLNLVATGELNLSAQSEGLTISDERDRGGDYKKISLAPGATVDSFSYDYDGTGINLSNVSIEGARYSDFNIYKKDYGNLILKDLVVSNFDISTYSYQGINISGERISNGSVGRNGVEVVNSPTSLQFSSMECSITNSQINSGFDCSRTEVNKLNLYDNVGLKIDGGKVEDVSVFDASVTGNSGGQIEVKSNELLKDVLIHYEGESKPISVNSCSIENAIIHGEFECSSSFISNATLAGSLGKIKVTNSSTILGTRSSSSMSSVAPVKPGDEAVLSNCYVDSSSLSGSIECSGTVLGATVVDSTVNSRSTVSETSLENVTVNSGVSISGSGLVNFIVPFSVSGLFCTADSKVTLTDTYIEENCSDAQN